MMETTVVHFSGTQAMLMLALLALAVLLPVWAIRRIARAVPPAYTAPGAASGVGGLLLFTIVMLVIEAVFALYHFGRAAGEAARVITMSADYIWPVVQTMIPDFSASFFLLIAIGARKGTDMSTTFGELEDIWNAYGVFGRMDDE